MRPWRSRLLRSVRGLSLYGASVLVAICFLVPVWWVLSTSVKVPADYNSYPPVLIPTRFSLDGWASAFTDWKAGQYLRNSIIVTFGATLVAMVIGSAGAYGLLRFPIRGSSAIAFTIIALRMFPAMAIAIPLFAIFRALGLLNTYWGLIIAYQLFLLPFVVWMMRGFFEGVPRELEEAAQVDGCSPIGAFVRVTLPLTAPGWAATATFASLLSWNEFLSPLLFAQTPAVQPVSMLVGNFVDPSRGVLWGPLSAVASVSILPVLAFSLVLQRYLLRGLTLGAMKG